MLRNRFFLMLLASLLLASAVAVPASARRRRGFVAGLVSRVDSLQGVQINTFSGVADKEFRGVQLAGLSNLAGHGRGVQIAALTNASVTPFRGVQLSGVTNIAMGVKRGVQLSGIANICSSYMRGLQTALYNYADTLNGTQTGLINVCVNHPRGVQIGIVNYSRDTIAHKVGLVNVNPNTRIDLLFYGGTSTKINLAVRFRNRSTYNILGFGTHYMGLDERFSGALFYRIGQYFRLSPRFSLSGDVGYYHIETFREHSVDKPERLYSIQGRINADYSFGQYTGVFVSAGYGYTRYYTLDKEYRQRPVVEAGLTFRLMRK